VNDGLRCLQSRTLAEVIAYPNLWRPHSAPMPERSLVITEQNMADTPHSSSTEVVYPSCGIKKSTK
jgi:hypothetical protein